MSEKNAVLLGLFDSVHTGHLQAVNALKQTQMGEKLVYTFNLATLDTKGQRAPLITDEQKEALLISAGADRVVSVDFSSVKELSPEEFVDRILIGELNAGVVLAGNNFRFGKNAAGDMEKLSSLCDRRGIAVICVPLACDDEGVISTTRIRALLEKGNIPEANRLLGRRYSVSGSISHGNALGRQWGIPTLNQPYKGCLKRGVYATDTVIDGKRYPSVTNVGAKPTVTDGKNINAETHILDFSGDVYGREAVVEFLCLYREERKFPDRDSLVEAITKDITRRKDEI